MLNDRGVQALSAAVVVQAVRDWNYCRMVIASGRKEEDQHRRDGEDYICPMRRLEEIERFFMGRWFGVLCDADGGELLDRLRAMKPQKIISFRGVSEPENDRRKDRCGSWRRLGAYPELQERLWKHRVSQTDVCNELGVNCATLAGWLKKGLYPDQLKRVSKAADEIIKRREKHG